MKKSELFTQTFKALCDKESTERKLKKCDDPIEREKLEVQLHLANENYDGLFYANTLLR